MTRRPPALLALGLVVGMVSCSKPAPEVTPKPAPATVPAAAVVAARDPDPPGLAPLGDPETFLEAHVRRWALHDPKNPWALCHALPIVGPDARLENGQTVLEAILGSAQWKTVDGKRIPGFPGTAPDGTPREPHDDLVIAALYLAKIPPETAFSIEGKPTTVGALYEAATFTFEPPEDGAFGSHAWTLSAIAAAPGKKTPFVNRRGQRVDPMVLARQAVRNLAEENAFLDAVRISGAPLQKRRQGIYAEACGGFHYIEGVARILPYAKDGSELKPTLERIVEQTSFRLRAEAALYDRTHAQAPARYQRLLWIQELKFFGHYLESMGVVRDGGVPVRPEDIAFARQHLVKAIESLRSLGAFEQMAQVNAERHQSYLDLIGDSAHALQGLRAWRQPASGR